MLKPVYFAFVKNMLDFFANYTHFVKSRAHLFRANEQNNRDDSFERRHFDEGRPCGETPCTSLVQRVAHAHAKKTPVPRTIT